jgi:murein DD-endopeptidase MepM/ murein hydrolase activator NlpD
MELTYPLQGKSFSVTSNFGQRDMGNHKGIDLKAESGTPVVAASSGRIVKADATSDPNGYGGQVLIRHDAEGNTFYTKYGHLRKINVSKGALVSKGQVIGESGGGKNDPNRGCLLYTSPSPRDV